MKAAFGIVGALLSLTAVLPYAAASSRPGRESAATPRLASWIVWSLQSVVDVAVTVSGGERTGALLLVAYVISNVIGLRAAIRSGGIGRLTRLDLLCCAAGLVGIVVWAVFSDPDATVAIQIAGSVIASLPTVVNALGGGEPVLPWLMWALGADLNLLALDSGSFQSVGLPVYFAVLCSGIWLASLVGTRRARA